MFDVKLSDLIPHLKMRNTVSPNLTEVWQKLMNFYKVFTYYRAEGKKRKFDKNIIVIFCSE